ncbi:molecular chaperone [Pseudomonas sp. RIT-PI-S]|uniref:molecular chaperone n=1 Tax=Pseudomonas sp. RIT-PI-S TaxID=3035295 RepID=UPI0021DAF674|nr:molecular chaperone [Pseudomonas sp. RIT-PI-S]
MATPALDSGALYDYLAAGRTTFTKRIGNVGDATAFVRVEVAELTYGPDGKPQERALEGTERPLIASPSRLIIPPGSYREIRVVYRGGRAAERYFRLRFVPVVPRAEEAFGLAQEAREEYQQAIVADVGVLKAIGGVVLVSPRPALFQTSVEQHDNQLRVANRGNTTVVLEGLALCQGPGECGQGKTVHVRPGKTFTLKGEKPQRFLFTLIEGKDRRRYTP